MKKISILLVDDHAAIRQGLRALLELEPDIKVVAEARNGPQAVKLARKNPPDVMVIDLAVPGKGGMDATRRILAQVPETKVLALTSYGDDACVDQLMQAGAAGLLIKQTAVNDVISAVRKIKKGKSFFTSAIAQRLAQRQRAQERWQPALALPRAADCRATVLSVLPPPATQPLAFDAA
jgi:DNA-binding NarL/FixJ family response regulator